MTLKRPNQFLLVVAVTKSNQLEKCIWQVCQCFNSIL